MGYPVQKGRSHFFITELSSGYNWVTGKEGLAMRGYCPTCNSTEELAIINKKETYPVKGEKITIDARVAVCKACGTEVFVGEIEFENLENAYRIYRDRHGIVPAEEIRSLRKKPDCRRGSLQNVWAGVRQPLTVMKTELCLLLLTTRY